MDMSLDGVVVSVSDVDLGQHLFRAKNAKDEGAAP